MDSRGAARRLEVEPHEQGREWCPRCRLPASACYCKLIATQHAPAKLVFLQHPREAKNPVGTARMAHLSVEGSTLLEGVLFENDERFRAELERAGEDAAVLFPTPEARDVAELGARERPATIFVIDGTWFQAQKIWKRNPTLRALPAYRIQPKRLSRYEIRSEPAPHCLSTIEATAELLEALEGAPGSREGMLAPFLALVERQKGFAGSEGRTPRRRRPRDRSDRRRPLPELLRGRLENALLVFGEGNGWPASTPDRPPTELVHWTALRPETGETFSEVVRPRAPVSPTAPQNLLLSEAEIAAGLDPQEFLRRWRAFVRPDDVMCTWSWYSMGLLQAAGEPLGRWVDVRAWCCERLGGRIGSIEKAARLLEVEPEEPAFYGRAGLRLQLLDQLFDVLVEGASAD